MQVSPFEMDLTDPGDRREKPGPEAAPVSASAAPGDAEDAQQREDPPEEPGYGHGV